LIIEQCRFIIGLHFAPNRQHAALDVDDRLHHVPELGRHGHQRRAVDGVLNDSEGHRVEKMTRETDSRRAAT